MRAALLILALAGTVGTGVLVSRDAPRAVPLAPAARRPLATADPANTARAEAIVGRAREATVSARVAGGPFLLPIEGVSLSSDAALLPGSAREYRAGWHEGVDFPADRGTAVRAVADGIVIRVDRAFVDWDAGARRAALAEAAALGSTPETTLDRIRGRQVWIDHGRGVVSRYAHLDAVADLPVGQPVTAGTVVGTVGDSGLPEGGPHLHLELRVGDGYLGEDLEGSALAAALARAFR